MATIPVTTAVEPTERPPEAWSEGFDPADPFRYGWRFVRQLTPGGTVALVRVPLTLEDVLHPEEEDFIAQSDAHHRRCTYLYTVLTSWLADDPTAVVLGDTRIAWGLPYPKAHGPDIAVFFGVRERKDWPSFDVVEEGVIPELIIEVASPETAYLDRANKLEEYDLVGVPYYVLVDLFMHQGQPTLRLFGYVRGPQGYRQMIPDERGWLWLEPVGLWIGITDNEIVCYDPAGQPLGDHIAVTRRMRAAEARVEVEATARRDAEARAEAEAIARRAAEERQREAEAELRRLRGE